LAKHVELYPKSRFAMAAQFFEGSNQIRLQRWSAAAALLDKFLEKFPDAANNPYLPFALYDRATAHFYEDQPDEALTKIERIEKEFGTSPIMAPSYNLRGNVLQSKEDLAGAETAFRAALKIAEDSSNRMVAGESLSYLISLLGGEKMPEESLKAAAELADQFWTKYADGSAYKIQVSVGGVRPYRAVGKGEEALGRLRDAIAELAGRENNNGMEEAINSYTEFYLEEHTPEELKEHYYNFPKVRRDDKAARALLHIAVIGVFEKEQQKAGENQEAARRAEAMITVLFRELGAEFTPKDLSPFILVRLGDYLREKTKKPEESLPYYDEAIARNDPTYQFSALFGRADVKGKSASPADLDQAIADLSLVYKDVTSRAQKESALYRLIEISAKKKDHEKVEKLTSEYLDRKGNNFVKWSGPVGLLRGQSFEARGDTESALATYLQVWSSKIGTIHISAPAIEAWLRLVWQRNKPASDKAPADRQGAYERGYEYVEMTRPFLEKMTPEEKEMWKKVENLVADYQATPGIKSMEEVRREKEEQR
jgi:tetratricopeptide (TPR) repeat protein